MSQSSGFGPKSNFSERNQHSKPLSPKTFVGRVRDLTYKGFGVVDHPNGRVYFVDGAWIGDEAEFEITESDKRFGFARILNLITPSKDRVESPCKHHGFKDSDCGGCPWMMINYEAQTSAKVRLLKNQMTRAKIEVDESVFKPIITSTQFGYRNRAQLKTNGLEIGYVSRRSKSIAPIEDCIVLNESCRQKFAYIKNQLPNHSWKPKDKFLWNFFDINDQVPLEEIKINSRLPFLQGNTKTNFAMRSWLKRVISELKLSNDIDSTCIELFSGAGNFTTVISETLPSNFKILATEIEQAAIDRLNQLNIKNVSGIAIDIYDPSTWVDLLENHNTAKVLVLDPPREGFLAVGDFLKAFKELKHVIYISCDVSTFARDLKAINAYGFIVQEIQPVDQFPNTSHLETLCVLSKS